MDPLYARSDLAWVRIKRRNIPESPLLNCATGNERCTKRAYPHDTALPPFDTTPEDGFDFGLQSNDIVPGATFAKSTED
jgi:hypothetical protein